MDLTCISALTGSSGTRACGRSSLCAIGPNRSSEDGGITFRNDEPPNLADRGSVSCGDGVAAGGSLRAREYHGGVAANVAKKVLLAWPRGYCAGVDRAVETVERLLAAQGPPVYVRKQIVHNLHVVRDLEAKGAIFVEEETEVPEGATVVLSAHGVAPSVHASAASRGLSVIDATCPLVTKVHLGAGRFAREGRTILLIGHEGHEEVVGTSGEAPDHVILVGSPAEAETVEVGDLSNVSYLTQTTLSVDETNEIIDILRRRFPAI